MSDPDPKIHRLVHFTPLRYPGGKGKLAAFVKSLMKNNRLLDGDYVEPYAGGAAIGLELLFHEYVYRIHINDVSRPVYSFWKSILERTDEFIKLVVDTPVSVKSWDRQKRVVVNSDDFSDLELGFATFFLNRTNRSGILNGGVIGGRSQRGAWKIDARYNAVELVRRIEAIASMRDRISLTKQDAIEFVRRGVRRWSENTLIYLDPPYYTKGRDLYYDYYGPQDHEQVATLVCEKITAQKWVVSYDNVAPIRDLYRGLSYIVYDIGYSARSARLGSEVMFFSPGLRVPHPVGPIRLTEDGSVCQQNMTDC